MINQCCGTVALVDTAVAVAGTLTDLSPPVAVVLVVLAEACVHVLRRRVYVLPAGLPRSESTALACGVRQSLYAVSQ